MCHEATSVGLAKTIGIGNGTVSLEDLDHCELIIAMGHNPGTNHPRMMGILHERSRRGVPAAADRTGVEDPFGEGRVHTVPGSERKPRGRASRCP